MSTTFNDFIPISANDAPKLGSDRLVRWSCAIALLVALASCLTVAGNPFYDPDEFNYITAARTMVEQGDWITPHFNGDTRLYKPVLFYWIVAGSYEIFGVHIAAARLCSAAGSVVGVFGVWLIARHMLEKRVALLAATIAAGHLTVLQISRSAITDTWLWAFCTLAQYGFLRLAFPVPKFSQEADLQIAANSRPAWPAALFFVGLSLALLTKGPVAFLWCLLPVVWLLIKFDWAALKSLRWGRGLIILLVLVTPWASVFIYRNHTALKQILWDSNSYESYSQFSEPAFSLKSMARIFPSLLPSILPWIPFIVIALVHPRKPGFTARTRCVPFLIFWLSVMLVILTINNRKSFRYMFPLIVPTTLLLTGWLDAAFRSEAERKPLSDVALTYGLVAMALGLVIVTIIVATHGLDTQLLWLHVAVQFVLAIVLLHWRNSPNLHRLMPALMVAAIYLHSGLINITVQPLLGRRIAQMAPTIEKALQPDERLVLYGGISPRYLVFLARRNELPALTYDKLLSDLNTAKACLIRQVDWDTVPESTRQMFTLADSCTIQRDHALPTPDLSKNMETALLMLRKPGAATVPSSAPSP